MIGILELIGSCLQALMLIFYCCFFKKYLKNKYDGNVCDIKEKSRFQTGSICALIFCVVSILTSLIKNGFAYAFLAVFLKLAILSDVLCFLFITFSAMEAKYKYGIKSSKLTISVILSAISGAFLGAVFSRYFDSWSYEVLHRLMIEELICVGCYIIAILCVKSAVKNKFKTSKLD